MKSRSKKGQFGQLPKTLADMPPRVRQALEGVQAGVQHFRDAERQFRIDQHRIRSDARLSAAAKDADIAQLHTNLVTRLRELHEKGTLHVRGFIEAAQQEAERYARPHGDPLGEPIKLETSASVEARLAASNEKLLRRLVLAEARERVDREIDRLMTQDPDGRLLDSGYKLVSDDLERHLWETHGLARIQARHGTTPPTQFLKGAIDQAREERFMKVVPEPLLEELDMATSIEAGITVLDSVLKDFESPSFLTTNSTALNIAAPAALGEEIAGQAA
jgi:hypothetical protein